jgi:hypothetical protein
MEYLEDAREEFDCTRFAAMEKDINNRKRAMPISFSIAGMPIERGTNRRTMEKRNGKRFARSEEFRVRMSCGYRRMQKIFDSPSQAIGHV